MGRSAHRAAPQSYPPPRTSLVLKTRPAQYAEGATLAQPPCGPRHRLPLGPEQLNCSSRRRSAARGALESQPQQVRAVSCGISKVAVFYTWHEPKRQRRGCEVLRWYRAITARALEAHAHAATCMGAPCTCMRMQPCTFHVHMHPPNPACRAHLGLGLASHLQPVWRTLGGENLQPLGRHEERRRA